MLDKKALEYINSLLAKGMDVEIQIRKNTVVILSANKKIVVKFPVNK